MLEPHLHPKILDHHKSDVCNVSSSSCFSKSDEVATKDNAGGRQIETRSGVINQDEPNRDRKDDDELSSKQKLEDSFRSLNRNQ